MPIKTNKTIVCSPKPKCNNVWLVESLDLDLYVIYTPCALGWSQHKDCGHDEVVLCFWDSVRSDLHSH